MKEHNNIVIQALNDYLKVDKPGYGILVKGDWGCGKSFIMKRWMKIIEDELSEKEEDAEEDAVKLRPIYVSLNGISSVNQIDEALKKAISPFLHGKFMKGLGKALKLATSVALRVNVDLNGDNQPEQMVCTIDPKSLLEFDTTNVKGERILIFDDIERAKLPVDEVLGYINYYVEHVGCHVIMIGDVKKEKDEDSYKLIKEKTIGHEYTIVPETEEALEFFINEIDKEDSLGLSEKKQLISYCFMVSGVSNLRILRQSLYDYKMYVSHLPKDVTNTEEYENIKDCLLANFITVYAEFKSGNPVMENYNKQLEDESLHIATAIHTNKKPLKATPALDIQSKYKKAGLMETNRVFKQGYIECVINYLLEGETNPDFLRREIKHDRGTPWDKLGNYRVLNNKEFQKCLNNTASHLENGDFDNIDTMLYATCNMLTVIKRGTTHKYKIDQVIEWCTKHINEKYFLECKTQNDLYSLKNHAYQCMGYYQGESIAKECEELRKRIDEAFKKNVLNVKNSLTLILESLNDENVMNLLSIYEGATPDHSVSYSMSPIFSQVEPAKFVAAFVKLNNKSKFEVILFVKHHYHDAFYASNAIDFVCYYEEDMNCLPEIVKLLKDAAANKCLVDKENILYLAETLTQNCETIQALVSERNKAKDSNS